MSRFKRIICGNFCLFLLIERGIYRGKRPRRPFIATSPLYNIVDLFCGAYSFYRSNIVKRLKKIFIEYII